MKREVSWQIILSLALLSGCLSEDAPCRLPKEWDSEDDHRFAPIVPKEIWSYKKREILLPSPVDYIVVRDGGKRCHTHAECLKALSNELRDTVNSECQALDNFYIGGDGEAYEGRGWDWAPYWHLNGMRKRAVTVKFLGTHDTEGPNERAMRAFWRMAKAGVWQSRLSSDYHVLSMGQVYNDSALVGHALEKVFREHSVGLKGASMIDTWETTPDRTIPLITREEWGAKKPTKSVTSMGFRIKHVMINEGGERCFTHEECKSLIKEEQENQMHLYGDLIDNFYIGDDGYVYEGRGFNFKPLWEMELDLGENKFHKDDSMTVRIFGKFQSVLPSEKAISALKLLVNAGISLKRISNDYKLFSLRGVYNDSRFLGDKLFHTARNWKPWDHFLEDRIAKKIAEGDSFIRLVKRTTWEAKNSTKLLKKLDHLVKYIIIEEHSEFNRCLDSKKCSELMKKVQAVEQEGYGDVRDNFYVSDTGNIYEGRGWDLEPQFQPNYFNKTLITVNFLGNYQAGEASLMALAAFDNLIRVGVKLGKIASNYHLYSSREVYGDSRLLGDALKKYFVQKEQWSNKLEAMSENDRFISGLLPIVPHKAWSDVTVNKTHHRYTEPGHYVVIGNIGERCYTCEECASDVREMQNKKRAKQEGLSDNFYIADDGMVYEGRGWSLAPSLYKEGLKSEIYLVTFLGQYGDESKPSRLSILAFNRLMQNGVKNHRLAPNFKIVSIHQIMESGSESDDNLFATVKTWDRWFSEFIPMFEGDGMPSGKIFVSREDWYAKEPVHTASIPNLPVHFVVVNKAGDDCGDLESCKRIVQAIQRSIPSRQWDVADNFYVGDDGHIYEGRGWDHSSLWNTLGIENNFISVGFLGSFEKAPPTPRALLAFHVLVQTGVSLGKLVPYFDTISLGNIMEGVVTKKLIGALKTTDNWSDDFDLKYDPVRLRSLNSSLILADEWNLSDLKVRKDMMMWHPLKYVAIRDGGDPCDTFEACIARINKEHQDRRDAWQPGVTENFYIGSDGNVYEGTGWDWDMSWIFNGWQEAVSVQFFGKFESSLPSEKAIEALKSIIIMDGIETGKLSPDYHIVPIPEGQNRTLGNKLKAEIMTWDNAIETIPLAKSLEFNDH